jgi:hypothetical protein
MSTLNQKKFDLKGYLTSFLKGLKLMFLVSGGVSGLCEKSFGLFTQPIIFFYEVVLRKKRSFFLKTTS